MRVIVTSLFGLGVAGELGVPTSFSVKRSWALPASLKTHGVFALQGGSGVAVATSDKRNPEGVPEPPADAWSESMTSMTGALPWRTTSPHEIDAAKAATSPRRCEVLRIQLLALDDSRRDEDQELGALIVDGVALEQPTEQRDLAQPGRPIVRRLLLAGGDRAGDRR